MLDKATISLKRPKTNAFTVREAHHREAVDFEREVTTKSYLPITSAEEFLFLHDLEPDQRACKLSRSVQRLLVYVHGECKNVDVEAEICALVKPEYVRSCIAELDVVQRGAMESTIERAISAAARAVLHSEGKVNAAHLY